MTESESSKRYEEEFRERLIRLLVRFDPMKWALNNLEKIHPEIYQEKFDIYESRYNCGKWPLNNISSMISDAKILNSEKEAEINKLIEIEEAHFEECFGILPKDIAPQKTEEEILRYFVRGRG